MKLPEISVKRPISTAMVFLAVLLFGLVSLTRLPLDIMPDLEFPALTVITVYPGASADEVEKQVSKELESMLAGAENLKDIESTSKENVSFVKLKYNWGTNVTEAANNARDLIELVKRKLPQGAENPIIFKINSSMMPVLVYGISAKENHAGLQKIIEDEIASPIRKVEGVGTVISLGQPEREISINVNPEKLKAYKISITQIATILKAENITIPGGNIKIGINDFAVRVPGEIKKVEDLNRIAIANFNGKVIRIGDVATLHDGFAETDAFSRTPNGLGAAFMVQKQSGTNTLEVINNVRAAMAKIKPMLPPDVQIDEIMTTDEVITESIRNLTDTLWYALLFVIIVVFAFLREWKGSFIVFLTIPFSLIIAFIVMFSIGWTINIFSLMALIIAIGMVVDNAIVVLENITQHIEKGTPPREASIFGTSEMGMAISASTLTTLMVFIPMIFMGGVVGILFKQLAVLTAATMIASLFTALSLTPMATSRMLKGRKKGESKKHGFLFRLSEKALQSTENAYRFFLAKVVHYKTVTLLLFLALLIVTGYVAKNMETDYIPEFDAGDIAVVIETEVGTSAIETDRVAQKVMAILADNIPEMKPGSLAAISGQTSDGSLTTVGFSEGKNVATVLCHLTKPDKRERTAAEIGEVIREKVALIPEVNKFHVVAGNILSAALLGNEKPIEVKISGKDFIAMNKVAKNIKLQLEQIQGLTDIESSVDQGKLEIQIIIDREKASLMALNSAMIGLQIRQSIYGTEAGSYTEEGEDYDINIRYAPEDRNNIDKLGNIQLTNLLGQKVTLSAVATIQQGTGQLQIERESQERIVTISSSLDGISLGKAAVEAQKIINNADIPQGVSCSLGGQVSSQGESFGDLYLVLLIGILLVYMVMAAQFESFKHPFIIMLAVPFTIVGVIWTFKITGLTLSVTTFIGIIMLMGIVVNNGIVLVDYTNLLRSRGFRLIDAVLEAGRSRMRPVLMTSLTTILAMVPMALSTGMGREMFTPLGITIIGGLLFSTIITLILVPTLYTAFHLRTLRKENN